MANNILNPNICKSKLNEFKSTFIWEIHNFSDQLSSPHLDSGIFSSTSPSGDPVTWSFRFIFPSQNFISYGIGEHDEFYISIKLVDATAEKVSARIKVMFRNDKGEDVERIALPNRIFTKGQQYRPSSDDDLILRCELFEKTKKNGYLQGDLLTVVFEVTYFEPKLVMECCDNIGDAMEFPEHSDVGHLFEQGLFTDCTLVSEDGTKFEVNKCILASKSPVFAAMFSHEMVEANEGIVKIEDIKSSVLEQLLHFIYSGKAPKLGEMAEELFEAADKYKLDKLKILCGQEFVKLMGNENVCELLVLADRHCVKYLKTRAIKYIQLNAKEVMESDGWKQLVKEKYVDLMEQIMKALAEAK